MDKDYLKHPVILKAKELAEAILQSEGFKGKNAENMQSLIAECNLVINETIKLDYGQICQPKGGCCG